MAPPLSPADLVGQRIDDYQVTARLGGGGMGVVYAAAAPDGTKVAIKTLKPAFANDRELVGRFLGEARALKAIKHRAMVDIHAIGELPDGTHYMVMEFLEGRSFEDVIRHGAPLDPREVLTWMVEVLDALDAVHAAGVIHRDLKPSNLYLARTGVGPQVKLIDFGIAKHTGASGKDAPKTLVSAIVGTPDYMSPEQVNGLEVTAASDLYALGCVIFEMLTGKVPFQEESSVKKMLMHVEQPAPRIAQVIEGVPAAIEELVAWTMQKEPGQRPKSARVLRERIQSVLREVLGGEGPALTQQIRAVRDDPPTQINPLNVVTEPSIPISPAPSPARVRRRRTEPVAHRARTSLPLWALGAGGLGLLGLVLGLVWFLTRPPVVPLPPVTPLSLPPPPVEAPVEPAAAAPEPARPPDRPIPKRKKPAAPTRKKPVTGKRR